MSLSDLYSGLKPGEQAEDLQNGLVILQRKDAFRFGTDAVLLSDFTKVKNKGLAADFGTGTGIIALLLAARNPDISIHALEIQSDMADMAARSVQINGLEARIQVHEGDIRDAAKLLGWAKFDTVVCNPPYYDSGKGAVSQNETKKLSRTAELISIEEVCRSAFDVLKSGGRLSVVYPAMYLDRLFSAMKAANLAPKRVRTVHYDVNHAPKIVLADAIKHGGDQLDWLPPLILRNPDGSPSDEWNRIYG